MDSVGIKIESDVPLPARQNSIANFPFHLMMVGDSFLVGYERKYAAKTAMGTYRKKVPTSRFATRTTEEGYRIWRTA